MNVHLYIQPLHTWEIVNRFQLVAEETDYTVGTLSVGLPTGDESVSPNTKGPELRKNPAWEKLIEYLKARPFLFASYVNMHVSPSCSINYREADDKGAPFIQISTDEATRARFVTDLVAKHFVVISKSAAQAVGITGPQRETFQFAQQVVASLASETSKISSATVEAYTSFMNGIKEHTLALEQTYAEREKELKEQLSVERKELEDGCAGKLADLEAREKMHAEAVKQFELRNNTAVRRDLLRELRTKIENQKRIEISKQTSQMRWVIHVVCILTIIGSGVLIGFLAARLLNTTASIDWKLLVPLSTWTALFVTTGIFYLRWNDRWFRDHARVEFENRKFAADILRASWVAELFFEGNTKEKTMPDHLIQSFTRELFQSNESYLGLHPADQVSELLKQVSSLEVGKSGFKVTKAEEKK